MKNTRAGSIISYIIAAVFLCIGFYKMLVYEGSSSGTYSYDPGVNAYVGGDAYNYIINANYATAYFTLAIFCAVIGLTFIIAGHLGKANSTIPDQLPKGTENRSASNFD